MAQVHILDATLTLAAPLAQLLARRRLLVERAAEVGQCRTLVMSDKDEAAVGGMRGLVEKVKAAGARSVVVVTENAAGFDITEDLGGRLLRVKVPALTAGVPAIRDCALLNLADVVATGIQAMVAADPSTGQLLDLAARVARTDVTVFINGPTGSEMSYGRCRSPLNTSPLNT